MHWANSRDDVGTALDKPVGLAVLGFFFEIDNDHHNSNYDTIINNLRYINETSALCFYPH